MSTTTNGTNGTNGGGGGGNKPLFPLRTAFLLLAALAIGSVIGLLTFAGTANLPTAVIAGIFAAGATLYYGHGLLGDR